MKSSDTLLTPREAAAAIGVSYPTVKHWILTGKLKTITTPGGHHRIPGAALKRYLPPIPKPPGAASRERFRNVSGRNQLVGTIVEVKISGLLAKVVLEIGDTPQRPAHHLHHHRRRRARDAAPQRPDRCGADEVHRSHDHPRVKGAISEPVSA